MKNQLSKEWQCKPLRENKAEVMTRQAKTAVTRLA